jgi:hypothetical protein
MEKSNLPELIKPKKFLCLAEKESKCLYTIRYCLKVAKELILSPEYQKFEDVFSEDKVKILPL